MEILAVRLSQRHPAVCQQRSDSALRDLCRAAFAKAAVYGIASSEDLLLFAGWMLTIHPHFEYLEDGAWARLILQRPGLSGAEKISMIASQMPHRALATSPQETSA